MLDLILVLTYCCNWIIVSDYDYEWTIKGLIAIDRHNETFIRFCKALPTFNRDNFIKSLVRKLEVRGGFLFNESYVYAMKVQIKHISIIRDQ